MSSILNDIKHMLGLLPADTAFDSDIILHINGAFGTLTQLGLGPTEGYEIVDESNEWDEFYTEPRFNSVPTYIFLRTKMSHDPPDTGFQMQAYERQIQELEFRLNVAADYG